MTDTTPVDDYEIDYETGKFTAFRKIVNYQGSSIEQFRPGFFVVRLRNPDGGETSIYLRGEVSGVDRTVVQQWPYGDPHSLGAQDMWGPVVRKDIGGVAVVGGELAAIDERGRSQGTLVAEVEVGEPAPFRVITGLADAPAVYTKAPRPPSEHDTRLDVVNTDSPPPHDEV